jgi:hypothetical protein
MSPAAKPAATRYTSLQAMGVCMRGEGGFFRLLWRVNAVLAFAVAIAGLWFIAVMSQGRLEWPALFQTPAKTEPQKAAPNYTYALEPNLLVGGAEAYPFKLYRLMRWDEPRRRTARTPYATAAAVNILVVDKETGANHWLFRGFDRAILSQDPLMSSVAVNETWDTERGSPIRCLVLRVADTGWQQSLYVWRYDGSEPLKVLTADQIWMADQIERDKYLVSYKTGSLAFFATYSVPDFQLLSQVPIKDMPE